jgi:hypothetical protein
VSVYLQPSGNVIRIRTGISVAAVPIVLVVILSASLAAAQPCNWSQVWLETDQVGAIEQTDCFLQPYWNGVGDEWRLSLNAGDLMAFSVVRGPLRDPLIIAINPANAIVAANYDVFDGDRQNYVIVRASVAGTYRFLVTAGGLYLADFGGYTIRSTLITLPTVPFLQSVSTENDNLRVTWYEPLSPTPVLEYLLEIGLDAGSGNMVQAFSVAPSTQSWNLFQMPASAGLYSVRVRARNAFGWGPVSQVEQVRYPRLRIAPNLSWYAVLGHVHLDISPVEYPPPDAFELFAGTAPGQSDAGTLIVPAAPWPQATTLDFHGVPAGRYYVRVRERTSRGPGVFTEAVIVVH